MLGLFFTFAGIGAMAGPWIVGAACDWLGVRGGFSVVVVYSAILAIILAVLTVRQRAGARAAREGLREMS